VRRPRVRALSRGLAINEAVYGPDHPEVAATLTNLGNVEQSLGDVVGAAVSWRRALVIFETRLGPSHPHTVEVRGLLDGLPGV
jgi:Tfp pilus assembly protein PilF